MKKLVSIMLAFCILILQVGCSPAKKLSMDKAIKKNKERYAVVIHTPDHKYNLYSYRFTEDALVGELARYSKPKWKAFHVYTNATFDLYSTNISSQPITLERSAIGKITTINHFQRNPLLYVGILGIIVIGFATSEGGGYFGSSY